MIFDKIRNFIFNSYKKKKVMELTKQQVELLKDLSTRVPYGVKVQVNGKVMNVNSVSKEDIEIEDNNTLDYVKINSIKPYLRRKSSLTDEEKKEFIESSWFDGTIDEDGDLVENDSSCIISVNDCVNYIDFLNKYHIDYRNLIDNDLAIEVTEENNPYK